MGDPAPIGNGAGPGRIASARALLSPRGARLVRLLRRLALASGLLVLGLAAGAVALDRAFPLPLARLAGGSTLVTDRDGTPLRAFLSPSGSWRFAVEPDAVSPTYLRLLVAIEDRRFWSHPGIDPLAVLRALGQRLVSRHARSGASTLTMQVARMLEPRRRTWRAKLIEAARALQLEAHWSKPQILAAYLTLAPMGRNIEGVAAGARAWFGKGPEHLSEAEAAVLVALPRDPTRLRPDRAGPALARARARVLRRAVLLGAMPRDGLASALAAPLPRARAPRPLLAPHLAETLAREVPAGTRVETTLDAGLQAGVERVLKQALQDLPRPVTLAALVADWHSGAILARAGSADYFDARRAGAVDMTRALRSPGSTLKPFIYGMAFDTLAAHPQSILHDAATRFDDYAPHNFDGSFNGDVTIREALQRSLNLPAVVTLERLGPVVFAERFRRAGLPLAFGGDAPPALPLALGGTGLRLDTLVAAYAGLARGGAVPLLQERPGLPIRPETEPLFAEGAAAAVTDILAGMPPPSGAGEAGRIAFKTGTSFRFRDGWAVGFDGARVIGVWMGRADGGSCACVGAAAARLLFRLFDLLPPARLAPPAPPPALAGAPPPALARLDAHREDPGPDSPAIAFPVSGSTLLLDAGAEPVTLAATGGTRPYRWFVDGLPLPSRPFARDASWSPTGPGFFTLSVLDALGREARVSVRVTLRDGA